MSKCQGLLLLVEQMEGGGHTEVASALRASHEECLATDTSPKPVSLLIRGVNFAAAVARWVTSGVPRRSKKEVAKRLAICESCPHFSEARCSLCGCNCTDNGLLNKLLWATEKCPIGKWE